MALFPDSVVISIFDRDDRSDREVFEIENKGDVVLGRRNVEAFLFDDEVIERLAISTGNENLISEAVRVKYDLLDSCARDGGRHDDVKAVSGKIYVNLKKLLKLKGSGNSADAFMLDTLAPLISPPMRVHQEIMSTLSKGMERARRRQ